MLMLMCLFLSLSHTLSVGVCFTYVYFNLKGVSREIFLSFFKQIDILPLVLAEVQAL